MCDSAVGFDRRIGKRTLTLGVSGYLYRSAVLYYDSETETFWSQLTGEGVVGPLTGKRLKWIPTTVATWKQWRTMHPETTVLEPPYPVGAYRRSPYAGYRKSDRLMFPAGPDPIDTRFPAKSTCTIVEIDGKPRCYPHSLLADGETRDGAIRVHKDGIHVRVLDAKGRELPSMFAYWFAWCAFYPEGTVFGGGDPGGR